MGLRRRRSPWNRAGLRGLLLLPLPGGNRNRDRHKTRVQKKRPGPGLRGPFDPGMSGQGIIPELGRAHGDIRRACGKAGLSQRRRIYGVSCAAVWIKKAYFLIKGENDADYDKRKQAGLTTTITAAFILRTAILTANLRTAFTGEGQDLMNGNCFLRIR